MADTNDQERSREEVTMANGPVSQGASNKSAPMYNDQEPSNTDATTDPAEQKQPDYNKMMHTQASGTRTGAGIATNEGQTSGGGTLPPTGSTPGGINTSDSTVEAAGTSGGTVAGGEVTRDRGKVANTDLNQTTNTEDMLNQNSRSNSQSHSSS